MSLRIRRIRIHQLSAPITERFGWSLNWAHSRQVQIVEVETEEGLKGWGEGSAGGAELALGRSAYEIAAIWESSRTPPQCQRRRGAPYGAGIDIALWDVVGRALGKPVAELLGPVHRRRVEAYCTALYRKDWPDLATGLAEEARGWKARGYRRMKMKIGFGPRTDLRLVAAVREAVGEDVDLGVDSNCAYDISTARQLARELEPFRLMWWEEPLVADDLAGYEQLRRSAPMPIAAGETETTDWLILNYLQPHRVDILQPDLEHVGLTGFRQLNYLCWLNRIRLVPHNWGTALRTAATLHAMATCPPLTEALNPPPVLFEFDRTESPFRDAILEEKLDIDAAGASIEVPLKPGLGVTVVEEQVARFRTALREYN
jgi:D-galactarolactone cycloisomerase